MLASAIPTKFPIPWGNAAGGSFIRTIPTASQIGIQNGAASLTDGFPPLCFTPVASGGVPPFGQDMNGILKQITQWSQWQGAGGAVPYDAVFQTAIGGYPKGAMIASAANALVTYQSLTDNNTTNPDTGGAGWLRLRTRLSAATTFYVATTGNDSNDGLTPGTAWLTLQNAVNKLQANYDAANFAITVSIGAGTFGGFSILGRVVGQSTLNFVGAGSTTIINNTISADVGAYIRISSMQVGASAANALSINGASELVVDGGVIFTGCGPGANAIFAAQSGGIIFINANCTISGGGGCFINITGQTTWFASGITFTFTGTVAFSVVVAQSINGADIEASGCSFPGTVTGQRYLVSLNAIINTNGGGANYFPGNAAGFASTGGQYA